MTDTTDTIPLEQELPPEAERPLPGMRAWFLLFLVWMVGLAVLALDMFARYDRGEPGALGWWVLALMCFYLSLCTALLPLPTAWIILLAASPEVGLFPSPWLRVVTVAGLGAVATVMANLTEYHALAFLFRFGLGRRIRRMRVYQWAIRWFDASPFQALALIGFVPIPIDAIRWLAILRHYSRVRYGLAYFLGRGLRYLVFATFAVLIPLGPGRIVLIQVGVLVAALAGRLLWPRLFRRRALPQATEGGLERPAAVGKP